MLTAREATMKIRSFLLGLSLCIISTVAGLVVVEVAVRKLPFFDKLGWTRIRDLAERVGSRPYTSDRVIVGWEIHSLLGGNRNQLICFQS